MVEHAALGIDTIGHERLRWMGVHVFFLLSVSSFSQMNLEVRVGRKRSRSRKFTLE